MSREVPSRKLESEEQKLLASVARQLLALSGLTQTAVTTEAGYSNQIFSNLLFSRSVSYRAAVSVLDVLQRHTNIDWRSLVEERRAEIKQWKAESVRSRFDIQRLSSEQAVDADDDQILTRIRHLMPGQRAALMLLIDEFAPAPEAAHH